MARMTSQTSGPPARAARRPVGPDRKMIPGCSAIRRASSTSRFAAEDNDIPGFAATKEASRSATGGSNLTGVAARLLMTTRSRFESHSSESKRRRHPLIQIIFGHGGVDLDGRQAKALRFLPKPFREHPIALEQVAQGPLRIAGLARDLPQRPPAFERSPAKARRRQQPDGVTGR